MREDDKQKDVGTRGSTGLSVLGRRDAVVSRVWAGCPQTVWERLRFGSLCVRTCSSTTHTPGSPEKAWVDTGNTCTTGTPGDDECPGRSTTPTPSRTRLPPPGWSRARRRCAEGVYALRPHKADTVCKWVYTWEVCLSPHRDGAAADPGGAFRGMESAAGRSPEAV